MKFKYTSIRRMRGYNPETKQWDLPLRPKTKFGWWIELNWDEAADHYKLIPYFPDRLKRWICVVWGGHEPVDDQCMRPEHRYCAWCGASTPNAEVV